MHRSAMPSKMKSKPPAKKDEASYEFLRTPLARRFKEKHLADHLQVFAMIKQKRMEYLTLIQHSRQQTQASQKLLQKSLSQTRIQRQYMKKVRVKSFMGTTQESVEPHSFVKQPKASRPTFYVSWHVVDLEVYGPKAREGASLSASGGLLYLVGGQNMDIMRSVEAIDPVQGHWFALPPKGDPSALSYGHSSHMYQGDIIVYGGASGFNELTGKSVCQNSVRAFKCNERVWKDVYTQGGALEARKYHAAALYGDYLVIHGGINDRANTLGDVAVLNLVTCRWTRVELTGASIGCLYGHTATAYAPKVNPVLFSERNSMEKYGVYIFGGKNKAVSGKMYWIAPGTKSLHCKVVKAYGMPPSPRFFHSSHMLNSGNLVVFGGTNDIGGFTLNEVHVFNIEEWVWLQVKIQGEGIPCVYSHGSATDNDILYIFGGCQSGKFAKAQLLRINTNQKKLRNVFKRRLPPGRVLD